VVVVSGVALLDAGTRSLRHVIVRTTRGRCSWGDVRGQHVPFQTPRSEDSTERPIDGKWTAERELGVPEPYLAVPGDGYDSVPVFPAHARYVADTLDLPRDPAHLGHRAPRLGRVASPTSGQRASRLFLSRPNSAGHGLKLGETGTRPGAGRGRRRHRLATAPGTIPSFSLRAWRIVRP